MAKQKFRLKYSGGLFWLIFWLILFFPIGLVLLASQTKIISPDVVLSYEYGGLQFWLYFWAVLFFPVTLLLYFLNGSFVKTGK